MIDFKKEHIQNAGYCLFLAMTCGILGEKIHLSELGAAWAIGGAALEGFFHTLRDLFVVRGAHKISEGLPSKLNGDLERAIKSAYENTINDLTTETITHCDLNEPFLWKVNNFIRHDVSESEAAKQRLKETFFEPLLNSLIDEDEISKMLEHHQQLHPDEYLKKMIADKSLSFYDEEGAPDHNEFVSFISNKFAEHFRHHFKTELKNDERAKTVYFQTIEEATLENTEVIKGHTAIIKDDTADIRSQVRTIQADINLLLSKSKDDSLKSNSDKDDYNLSMDVNVKIKEAQKAYRIGKYELAKEIWNNIFESASKTNNQKLLIRVRLELAQIEVTDDSHNLDNALKIANDCLVESKKINLGSQVGHVLQLLGEIHRLSGNSDQARGFLNASFEFAKSINNKYLEGWALLALGMLSNQNKESFKAQFNFTKQAYDCFTNLLVSGEEDSTEKANSGYAFCHIVRATLYGYMRSEEALAEYSRAIALYKQMDDSWRFELGRALLERGEMKAMKDELIPGVRDIIDATEIFTALDDHYMVAKCTMACAEILDKQGHRNEAEKYFRSAAQIVSSITNEKKKSWFYFRYAMKLLELGEHDEAKNILLMLLSRNETTDSQKLDVLKTLSDLAMASKNEKELKEYAEYSLLVIEKLIADAQSSKERLRLLFNQGHTLHKLEKYELALETFQRAIRLAESISATYRIPDIWSSIADVYHKMKNPKEERLAYEQVLKLCGDNDSSPQLVTTLTMIAQMEMKEGNFNEARKLLDRAEILCKKMMPFLMFVINDIRQRIDGEEKKANK